MSNPIPFKIGTVFLCALFLASFTFTTLHSQSLVGGSLHKRSDESNDLKGLNSRLWLAYANHFQFKRGMSIDSDFGQQFFLNGRRRFSVRSVFLYDLSPHWKIGGGMGFFWDSGVPNISQELRLSQEIRYHKDFGSTIMQHRLQIEEQITQDLAEGDIYKTRLRYELDLTIPTRNGIYFGIRDEIFSNLSSPVPSAFISTNRFSTFIGYDTFNLFKLEAQVIMEDAFRIDNESNYRSWVFRLAVLQTI